MQIHEREVTLKLEARPLRLIYLVRSREDLVSAVTFYTHVWGGAANAILPVPENDLEVETLKLALRSLNPDYIYLPEGTPSSVVQAIEQFPVRHFLATREGVNRLVNEPNYCLPTGSFSTGFQNGSLPHIGRILASLHPTPLIDSNIRLIETGSTFDFELLLQGGFPTEFYQNYLKNHLSARVLPIPQTVEQFFKVSLLLARYQNPASITLLEVNRKEFPLNFNLFRMEAQNTLYFFLHDGEGIDVATAFWNFCRLSLRQNKLFWLKEAFLSDIEHYAALIVEVMPSIQALFVTALFDEDEAKVLANSLKNAFAAVGRNILVEVFYRNFRFNFIQGAAYCGQPVTTTQVVASDGSIRFSPSVPFGHENTDFVFGYDAEIVLASGRRLFIPATQTAAVLVSNKLEVIEFAEKSSEMQWLPRESPVRAAAKGIAGTAIVGKECRVYIPTDDVVITRQLKDAGFEVKPNKHTRYAEGFVKRLGGFEKARLLVNQGGLDIISVLRHPQAKEGGLNFQQLVEFMRQRGISKEKARNLLEQQLPNLLASGLVRRGYSLSCPYCDLTDWYSIENVGEFVECEGCAQAFQLSLKRPEYAYKPNELAVRFVEEGGQAVLMTVALFHQLEPSAFIKFGGDLLHYGHKKPFAEMDLFWITGCAFVVAECKSYHQIAQKEITRIKESLEKNVQVAILIDAQVVLLGVVTNSSELSELFAAVTEVAESTKEKKIGVHLALNGKLYLWGRKEVIEPWRIRLEELQIYELSLEEEQSVSVGKQPKQIDFGRSEKPFNEDVLQKWEQEVSI